MNYEEKYKEAIESIKRIYNQADSYGKELMEKEFPELRESEDEKIRKELLEHCINRRDGKQICVDASDYRRWAAWLEKQGEKTIPKNIDDAALQYVDTCAVDGRVTHDNINEPYWNNHSMMNAYKAGWLEKQGKQKPIPKYKIGDIIEYRGEKYTITNVTVTDNNFYYDVSLIEEPSDLEEVVTAIGMAAEEQMFKIWQNPTLSEEDEKIRKALIDYFDDANKVDENPLQSYGIHTDKAIAWLEKQGEQKHKIVPKFRVGDTIRFKGNETLKGEDKTHRIIDYDNELYVFDDGTTDLFSEQNLYELVEQKPSWSEEDEKMINLLIKILEVNHPNEHFKVNPIGTTNMEAVSTKEIVDWLKSIKPQKRWKPSEEQMDALNAINLFGEISYVGQGGLLVKLYQDLKKLRLC